MLTPSSSSAAADMPPSHQLLLTCGTLHDYLGHCGQIDTASCYADILGQYRC
ncbi:hypothetical protein LZ31DRAFT_557313 [Colletotrichum somersetense]|nr:hypothetical protein LZ31DRAFT_557313 [Colletotrichum somersetense]